MDGAFKRMTSGLLKIAVPTFGEEVDYRPKNGGSRRIQAVFDEEFLAVDPNTEALVSSNNPAIGIRLADLDAEPQQGDKVLIGGKRLFKVEDSIEDGQGGATLTLTRA